ncbi:MAG: peptide antibiotic transporter SbmA [Mesorhizobium sp.]|uniref:peptide antibiotic transporter SbmA n=1 Tax=unclassified Mesorhizobium TaxID=325217 RepID=UPI000FCBFFFA|nr:MULTISPECIES: peptide antibiotic transporter SbmA [unclassified Mesorhizobium]RUX46664.1 peptide antibiotic transporter SbmA [Mesorhizobium sp. M4A.F.Ca.ET.050.02.1.1]RVC78809.1 peptide antibiotic transporter SbmA [Mesorhizobium sp. M4A.F.Ca.ET.022.05.2.1]RVD34479.1 peptide antibiotic transporter SbmA [Mesorhizobium sp. M4A.F.Ca.ET.020.02.1.1]RWC18452.1 MAG: peptide antibiotic transporter SbmA [Mesorhizobium sp.]RWD01607.1 MAG: peptide antibiotic transporter SbmA [Mesorhizobium sp.]
MFVSFFPQPKLFFTSAALWSLVGILFWFFGGQQLGAAIGLPPAAPDAPPILGVPMFWSAPFLWFYIYFAVMLAAFYLFWRFYSPHPWQNWSILVSAFILFSTYINVQIYVALNNWRGPFFDLFQKAISAPGTVSAAELYSLFGIYALIGLMFISLYVVTKFVVSHYIFRWRTAMNDFYAQNWSRLRHIEGASQRVQEDTMRFSTSMEQLGVAFADSLLTLIAFLPVLDALSAHITELPLIGPIPHSLVIVALVWSLFGTILLAVAGVKLPGMEFRNQRVEAAYRKELVYGEDDPNRASPPALTELFQNVRRTYFRYYFHYAYFNVFRAGFGQADAIFSSVILIPTIAAGKITLGIWQQISTAFGQVSSSFQYLVSAWPQIVELISIYKRLRAFEATLYGEPLPDIDQRYLAKHGVEDPT